MQVAVILADIVESRSIEALREVRDTRLEVASRAHREEGWTRHAYAVTAGDEFQNIVPMPHHVPRLVFDLRRRFRPHELRVAIGVGRVDSLPAEDEPVNVAGSGEAFERARAAMDSFEPERDIPARHRIARAMVARKYRYLTAFRSGDPELDRAVNIIYRLWDTLLQRVTDRQWQTISAYVETEPRRFSMGPAALTGRQDRAAELLGVDASTFSRNLARGGYWQSLDAIGALTEMLEEGGS